jgi:mono/diheme cytochrome c family protein
MWKTNLKVLFVGVVVLGFYTMVAQMIPQLESAVPEVLDLSAGVTPEILVPAGEGLFIGAGGCTACHELGSRAPNLRTDHAGEGTIGQRCGNREPGMDCKTYLYESMTQPNAYLVDGFTGIMPDARRQLSNEQIWAIVAYLENQGGEVTVTASDIQRAGSAAATPAAGQAAPASFSAATDPMELLTQNACLGCHVIDGNGPPIGPTFDGMGSRLTAEQIRDGILDPNAEVAEGFDQFAGMMPATFGQQMSAQQLETMVQFLAGRR